MPSRTEKAVLTAARSATTITAGKAGDIRRAVAAALGEAATAAGRAVAAAMAVAEAEAGRTAAAGAGTGNRIPAMFAA